MCVHVRCRCTGVQGILLATALHPTTQESTRNNGYSLLPVPSKLQSGFEAVVVFPLEGSLVIGSAAFEHRGNSGGTSLKSKKVH